MSSEVRKIKRQVSPLGGSKGKQALSYSYEAKSQGDNQIVALGSRKVPPSQDDSGADLRHALNAKQSQGEGDLREKLVTKVAATTRSILPIRSEARTPRSTQMEQLSRYQTPFIPKIEGLEPRKKFTHTPNS